ncbi:hypothetical protein OKA04_12845 [Luteolibacter flavescens]|uniref:Uncharacterized protein n=1 Tax=Luteolibacter flavescens TaxID=1859460 RepID=A0ABT3FQY7_9BACT|nr:hypothetical protein [Luteolibacter flavescens]MCW1885619.1 hypothetical protein [Luteolibacter flavescens]
MSAFEKQPIQWLIRTDEFRGSLIEFLRHHRIGSTVVAFDDDMTQTTLTVATCELSELNTYLPREVVLPLHVDISVMFEERLAGVNPHGTEMGRERQGLLKGSVLVEADFDEADSEDRLTTVDSLRYEFFLWEQAIR